MSGRVAEVGSLRSSITDEDLEEARQRLLDHTEENELSGSSFSDLPMNDNQPVSNANVIVPNTNPPFTNYGTVANMSITSQTKRRKPPTSKRYRLPFLILLSFDWGLVVFFSIVVMKSIDFKEYFYLDIETKCFDLVIISTFRVVLNFLFYLVLGWVNRIIMTVTTLASVCYIPLKAYYSWDYISSEGRLISSIAIFMMLLIAFGMPWITAFFFEFKFGMGSIEVSQHDTSSLHQERRNAEPFQYLPAEICRLDIASWWNWKVWLWPSSLAYTSDNEAPPSLQDVAERAQAPNGYLRPNPGFSASSVSLDFRTPVGSSRASPILIADRHGDDDLPPIKEDQEFNSSFEHHSPECDQTFSAEDQIFKREALSALVSFKALAASNADWTSVRVAKDVIIYSRVIERRTVWKAEGVINTSAQHLFSVLYPGDNTPDWNSQCALNQTVRRVDDATDLVYTVSNAVGPISSRDFLSIRQREVIQGWYYAASKAITNSIKPEQPGKVRAENGPCGYLVYPVSHHQARLIWIINSNLKGWIPQAAIDRTLTTVLISSFGKLIRHVENIRTLSPGQFIIDSS